MTRALLIAVLAAAATAGAIVELAAAAGAARRAPRRASRLATLLARVDAAGLDGHVGVAEVLAVRWGTAVAAALAAAGPASLLPGRLGIALLLAAPAAGHRAPVWWLVRRAGHRRAAMAAELAPVLDLVAIAADAGLSPMRALAAAGRPERGPLAGELRAAATRAALGASHGEVLAQLARRCPLPDVADLTAAVARAERHGTPLAPGVRALAVAARARSAQALRDRAARAAPKIQLVVALVLVPAVMLMVAAALAPRL